MDAFISPNDTGGVMKQVDNSAVVDNIFVFTDGTDKFQWTNNAKGVYPLSQAKVLFGDIADKTSILQAVLNLAEIKTIVLDAQQEITINGTLNCGGKKILFTSGAKFTGTGTISNAVIAADHSDHIFDTTITLAGCKLAGDRFSVKWYGAKGDGNTNPAADDHAAIQKAGDTIIGNDTLPRTLYFPPGTYKILSPLVFFKWASTNYSFFSLNLVGQDGAEFSTETADAIIDASTIKETFAIGYQMARSSVIKGLVVKGAFNVNATYMGTTIANYFGPYRQYVSIPYETFTSGFGLTDERHCPYSGIVIDPFDNSGDLLFEKRYKGLEHLYRGTGPDIKTAGSSGIKIEKCRVYGFTVDIMLSPNGQTQNAENIHVIECTLEWAKVAYACGQDQSKDNFVVRCISWNRVHTLIDTISYGALSGQPPYVDGWNVAGNVIEIYRLFPLRTQCSFRNIFAESLWRVGTGNGGTGLTIYDSAFNFDKSTTPVILPPTHIEGGKVKFKNCVLKYYDNEFNKSIRVQGRWYTFEDCEFDKAPLLDFAYTNENIVSATFRNCRCSLGTLTDFDAGNGYFSTPNAAPYLAYGNITLRDGGILQDPSFNNISNPIIRLNATGSYQREFQLGVVTVTINDAARTGVLSGQPDYIKQYVAIGDYLTDYAGAVIGRITYVDRVAGTADVVDIPVNITTNQLDRLGVCWAEAAYGQFIGNLAFDSPVITMVDFDSLLPKPYVGQRLKIGHTRFPYVIVDINEGTKEITMSGKAAYTEEKAFNPWISRTPDVAPFEFTSMYTPQELAANNPWPVLIPIGAKMNTRRNGFSPVDNDTYICMKPGFLSPGTIGKNNKAIFDRKDERASDAIYFTVGDAGFPAASDTTYTNDRFINRNVVVFRNFVPQFNANPGGGATYITKTFDSGTITFSAALAAGEKIMIITC